MEDIRDLKSLDSNIMWVQVPPSAPICLDVTPQSIDSDMMLLVKVCADMPVGLMKGCNG